MELSENMLVMHESAGVCRIIGRKKMDRKQPEYFVLEPVYEKNSLVYMPQETAESRLRPVMTREEALALVEKMPEVEILKFSGNNEQRQVTAEIIRSGDRLRLAQLARSIYAAQQRRIRSAKPAYSADRGTLRLVEKLLFGEIASALELQPDEVPAYIEAALKEKAGEA